MAHRVSTHIIYADTRSGSDFFHPSPRDTAASIGAFVVLLSIIVGVASVTFGSAGSLVVGTLGALLTYAYCPGSDPEIRSSEAPRRCPLPPRIARCP